MWRKTYIEKYCSAVCGVPRREGLQVLRVSVPERVRHEEQENRPLRVV